MADWLGLVLDGLTFLVAVGLAILGIREYVRGGRWKAAELANAHLRRLVEDEELSFACRALDWGVGPIKVPAKYEGIVQAKSINHKPKDLETALEPQLNAATWESPTGLLYRWCFDALFTFLDQAQEMIDLQLVTPTHFAGLRYWLRHIADYPYKTGPQGNTVFLPFLARCEYGRVLRLFDTLAVEAQMPHEWEGDARKAKIKADPVLFVSNRLGPWRHSLQTAADSGHDLHDPPREAADDRVSDPQR